MLPSAAARLAAVTMVGLPDEGLTPAFEREFKAQPFAGVLLFRRHFRHIGLLPALARRLRALAAPRRILVAMDEEGGFVSQLAPEFPVPPTARVLGRAASEADVERFAAAVGGWLAALNVDINFAPVLDVDSERANPVIGPRSFGADPALVARLGAAALRGYREGGVLAAAKHFPGHGATALDSHLDLPTCDAEPRLLSERDLVPFREALPLASLVLTAHVRYPQLDDRPATLSPAIIGGLLRDELGFRGVVVTDAMEMAGVARVAPGGAGVLQALAAGCDLVLFGRWDDDIAHVLGDAAYVWERSGEDVLAQVRWESARGAVEALYEASLAGQRARIENGTEPEALDTAPLVPPGWDEHLLDVCRRALRWVGEPMAIEPGAIEILEPAWTAGPFLGDLLRDAGFRVTSRAFAAASQGAGPGRAADISADLERARGERSPAAAPAPMVVALPRRTALSPGELEGLRALCASRPTVVVALEQDAFLADLPEAAGRLSACDVTPAMRRAVALELAQPAGVRSA